jgi:hypothetical protein
MPIPRGSKQSIDSETNDMAAPPGINDEFSLEGFWWLPSDPDALVAGVLLFNQKDGPVLTLTGTFEPKKEAFGSTLDDRPVIHGRTKDGKAVSLFGALQTARKGGLGQSAVHEVYEAHLLAMGLHFDNEDAAIFTRSYVGFEDIEAWLGHRFFDLRHETESGNWSLGIDRSVARPLGRIDGAALSVGSGFYTDASSTSFTVTARCHIVIAPDAPQPVGWHFEAAAQIQGLASLCTGRHLPLRLLFLDGPEIRHAKDKSRATEVHIYASMTHPESQKTRRHESPMVRATDFPEPADALLQKWFDSYGELSSALYLFLTALADRAMFINIRFALAIQALEVFHRRSAPGTIIPDEEHAVLQQALIAAIPAGTSAAMREKLKGTLSFSNEPSLRQRLRALIEEVEAHMGEAAAGYDKAFVQRLVDTRNFYTHYSPDLENKILEGAELHYAIRRIVLLLIVLLLLRIGIEPATVREAIADHREFRQLWEKAGNPR